MCVWLITFTNYELFFLCGCVASMYDHRKSVHVPETDFNLFCAGGSASRQIEICIFYLIIRHHHARTEQIELRPNIHVAANRN